MTRENKLALIIGFGLVLVVGILVSDHLSAANRQQNAALQAEEASLTPGRLEDHRLLTPDYAPIERPEAEGLRLRPGPMAGNQSHLGGNDASASRAAGSNPGPGTILMPGPDQLNRQLPPAGGSGGATLPQSYKWHTIKPKETLAAIARREYGDEKLWKLLAQFNKDRVPNPDVVPAGVTIRLPSKEELLGITGTSVSPGQPSGSGAGAAGAGNTPGGAQPAGGHRTYTVQPGETLSRIAKRLLGSEHRWREIVDLNKDVIKNPDNVTAGTVIRVPNT